MVNSWNTRYVTIIHNDNLHNLLTDMSNKEGGIPNEARLENFELAKRSEA